MKKTLFYLAAAIVPALICMLYIYADGVNVLHLDEWEMVPFTQKVQESGLKFADLFAQHNEHRIFFAYLIYWGMISLSGFNSIIPMCGSFVIISLLVFVIVRYIAARPDISDKKKYFFTALISFLVYSLTQYENLLWGFQIGFIMVLFFSVLSFYFLQLTFDPEKEKSRKYYFAAALLAAFIASFSSSQGLIAWITGAVLMLFLLRKKAVSSPYFLVWGAVAVCTWVIYFHDYVKPVHHPSLTYLWEHPRDFLNYFFSITGNAISGSFKEVTTLIGIVIVLFLLIACIKIWKSKQVRQFFFPLALALNSLFILGSIAIGRAGFGVGQSLASRYTSFSICVVVGLALLWMELKDKNKKKTTIKNFSKVFIALLVLSIPLTMIEGFQYGKTIKTDRKYSSYILETYDNQPGIFLQRMYPVADTVRKHAAFLKAHQYNVFHNPQYATPSLLQNDSLGQRNDAVLQWSQPPVQLAPDFIVVLRPTVNSPYENKVKALYADVDGQIFPLYYKQENNAHPANPSSIYDISAIANQRLSPGTHTLKVKALFPDESGYYIIDPGVAFESK